MGTSASVLPVDEVRDLCQGTPFSERQMARLHEVFVAQASSLSLGDAEVDVRSVLAHRECVLQPMLHQAVRAAAKDRPRVSFRQLVAVLAIFSSKAAVEAKAKGLFQLINTDHDESLSQKEFQEALRLFTGLLLPDQALADIVASFAGEEQPSHGLSYAAFRELVSDRDVVDRMTADLV